MDSIANPLYGDERREEGARLLRAALGKSIEIRQIEGIANPEKIERCCESLSKVTLWNLLSDPYIDHGRWNKHFGFVVPSQRSLAAVARVLKKRIEGHLNELDVSGAPEDDLDDYEKQSHVVTQNLKKSVLAAFRNSDSQGVLDFQKLRWDDFVALAESRLSAQRIVRRVPCEGCKGVGHTLGPPQLVTCKTCKGKGWIADKTGDNSLCSKCVGNGKVIDTPIVPCECCNGKGNDVRVIEVRTISTCCPQCYGSGKYGGTIECPSCGGTGGEDELCDTCKGHGEVEQDEVDEEPDDCDWCNGSGDGNEYEVEVDVTPDLTGSDRSNKDKRNMEYAEKAILRLESEAKGLSDWITCALSWKELGEPYKSNQRKCAELAEALLDDHLRRHHENYSDLYMLANLWEDLGEPSRVQRCRDHAIELERGVAERLKALQRLSILESENMAEGRKDFLDMWKCIGRWKDLGDADSARRCVAKAEALATESHHQITINLLWDEFGRP